MSEQYYLFLVYQPQNECEISHNVGKDEVTDIFVQDCFIEMNGAIHNSIDRVPATRDEDKQRGAFKYDVRFEDGKGPFTNYVCIFWNFLTTYTPSLHFLCSKLHVFLTTYPP